MLTTDMRLNFMQFELCSPACFIVHQAKPIPKKKLYLETINISVFGNFELGSVKM